MGKIDEEKAKVTGRGQSLLERWQWMLTWRW